MECGDMKNLSGLVHGRSASANGFTRSNSTWMQTTAVTTPRSQTASSNHPTPRCAAGLLKSIRRGFGLGSEEFGGLVSPWAHREMDKTLSPRHRHSPRVNRRLIIASRDKESLMEEIIELKKALVQQSDTMRVKNAQSNRVGCQNRKLEMDVEELETALQLEGPRTGSPHRLRAKLQGLQMMVEELQETCETQREELLRLRRDIRVTRTREIEVERDVFAEEIVRLQKLLRQMQRFQNRICCENRDLGVLRNKYLKLEIANLRLESCITAKAVRPQSQPGTMRKSAPNQIAHPVDIDHSQVHDGRQLCHKSRV